MIRIMTQHIKSFFLVFSCADSLFLTSLKFGPKWQFLYFKPILAAIFVTIATVKVE